MNRMYTDYDRLRIELFEMLFPRVLYGGTEEEQNAMFHALCEDGNNLVHDLYATMCVQDELEYPYMENDFTVDVLERGGVQIIQINFPEYNQRINDVIRAYVLYMVKEGNITDKKYFAIKRFSDTEKVFVFHVDAENEPFIGEELTDRFGDMEYEYWKLVRDYARLMVKDMKETEEPTEWSRDWSKMEWQEIKEKLEALENMTPEEKAQADIGFSLDDFVEYLNWQGENEPEEYWKSIFTLKLRELGVQMDKVEYWVQHPEEFIEEIRKWSEGGEVE